MTKKNLLTILGFKLVWLSCILGELYSGSILGFITGIVFLLIFFLLDKRRLDTFKLILFFSLIGYSFDSVLSFFQFYKINSQINFLFLPLWFLVLWPCFCCLFVEVLLFLKNKKILAIILGSIFGPLTYYAGVSTGLASVTSINTFLLISIFWSSIMFTYSKT